MSEEKIALALDLNMSSIRRKVRLLDGISEEAVAILKDKPAIQILRARIPTQTITLSPEEKAELLRIGAECGHEIDGLLEVAKPATYKRWLAQMRSGRPFKAVGRPRLTKELRDVVIRIGSENLL